MKQAFKSLKALSLIEMMLVLVVVATILLLGVRYYSIAIQQANVARVVKDIQIIQDGAKEWLLANSDFSISATNGFKKLGMSKLVADGLVPSNYAGKQGDLYEAEYSAYIYVDRLRITLGDVPKKFCESVAAKLQGRAANVNCSPTNLSLKRYEIRYDLDFTEL